jgi:hypothetical protein
MVAKLENRFGKSRSKTDNDIDYQALGDKKRAAEPTGGGLGDRHSRTAAMAAL